jgi:hypothetical protein
VGSLRVGGDGPFPDELAPKVIDARLIPGAGREELGCEHEARHAPDIDDLNSVHGACRVPAENAEAGGDCVHAFRPVDFSQRRNADLHAKVLHCVSMGNHWERAEVVVGESWVQHYRVALVRLGRQTRHCGETM